MKTHLRILIVSMVLAATFSSCKKEQASAPSKDYSLSIKDKNWWGSFNNAGESVQYYTVHFNADGTLLWTQLSGDYAGTWALNGNKLTLKFSVPAVTVTADVSNDNRWINITTNTANKINNGQLLESSSVFLDNTTWNVSRTQVASGTTLALKFNFLPNYKVVVSSPGLVTFTAAYTTSPNGSIRMNTITPYFGIIQSTTEMRGNFGDADYHWQAAKQ